MKTICVKLTPTEFAIALELAGRGNFKNISDVVRQALVELARQWKVKAKVLDQLQVERNQHEPRYRKQPRLPFDDSPAEASNTNFFAIAEKATARKRPSKKSRGPRKVRPASK